MKTPKQTGDAKVDAAIRDSLRNVPVLYDCGRIDVVTAGEVFPVEHRLGSVPEFIFADKWDQLEVVATEDMRAQWTKDTVVVYASTAGTFRLYVGKM